MSNEKPRNKGGRPSKAELRHRRMLKAMELAEDLRPEVIETCATMLRDPELAPAVRLQVVQMLAKIMPDLREGIGRELSAEDIAEGLRLYEKDRGDSPPAPPPPPAPRGGGMPVLDESPPEPPPPEEPATDAKADAAAEALAWWTKPRPELPPARGLTNDEIAELKLAPMKPWDKY